MALPNIFTTTVSTETIQRINQLTSTATPSWGRMTVSQMLAHCNVMYEMVYDNKHPKANIFLKIFLKAFVKNSVVNETPYKHNQKTAPAFLITGSKNFIGERTRLINYITKTQQMGEDYFHNRESHYFGVLSKTEWNNMFYKHLDHHLTQFGV